jgi:diguanylate cyclase (GGDEF)-like protein
VTVDETSWHRRASEGPWGAHRVTYDSDAAAAVLPVSLGLGGVFVALLLLHPAAFGSSSGPVTTAVTAAGALIALLQVYAVKADLLPAGAAHAELSLLAVVAAVAATTHLIETRDPQESVPFLLLSVGMGAVLLRREWYGACLAVLWLGWAIGALTVGGTWRLWGFWAFYLAVTTVLGGVIHLLRRRSLDIASRAVDRALAAATEDAATGLSNRRGLVLLGRELVAVARRTNDAVHCSFIDVDGLKSVNDRLGHEAGDAVIDAVADALRVCSRETDVVARWGGDEFVIVGLGVGVPPLDLERRVCAQLRHSHPEDDTVQSVSISVGRAMLEPWDTGDLDRMLWLADRDMYVRRALKGRTVPPVITLDRTQPQDD